MSNNVLSAKELYKMFRFDLQKPLLSLKDYEGCIQVMRAEKHIATISFYSLGSYFLKDSTLVFHNDAKSVLDAHSYQELANLLSVYQQLGLDAAIDLEAEYQEDYYYSLDMWEKDDCDCLE